MITSTKFKRDTVHRSIHVTGQTWRDSEGKPIQAHGGGILIHDGAYYWYGENRDGPVRHVNDTERVVAVGVWCYRSKDLLTWENLGVVLAAVDDPTHELFYANVIERPKVIYNKTTRKFVMWLHVDSPDYNAARAGVAIADDPAGPFQYLKSYRPNGFESRDQTVFQDDDGRAYHICASDMNQNTLISLLSDDYLRPTRKYIKIFLARSMEAFALCKQDGRYWMLASGCTGWKPNAARSGYSDDLLGEWHELSNPCIGENADLTFGGQSAFIIPPTPHCDAHVAMFDIWRPGELKYSGYMWLPIDWTDNKITLRYRPAWDGRID